MKDKMPSHIHHTLKEWRHIKRQQLKVALKAISDLRSGCFYTPDRGEIQKANAELEKLKSKYSVKNWHGCRGE